MVSATARPRDTAAGHDARPSSKEDAGTRFEAVSGVLPGETEGPNLNRRRLRVAAKSEAFSRRLLALSGRRWCRARRSRCAGRGGWRPRAMGRDVRSTVLAPSRRARSRAWRFRDSPTPLPRAVSVDHDVLDPGPHARRDAEPRQREAAEDHVAGVAVDRDQQDAGLASRPAPSARPRWAEGSTTTAVG